MSKAGSGKPNRIPGMNGNEAEQNVVTPDLVWDEGNPPTLFSCSNDSVHAPNCNHNCNTQVLESELSVQLLNEAKAYVRLGASFLGVPGSVQMTFGIPGLQYDGFDLMCRIQALEDLVVDQSGIDRFELDERYRKIKLDIMQGVRLSQERQIKEQRTREMLGIGKPPLLGPNGQPLQ